MTRDQEVSSVVRGLSCAECGREFDLRGEPEEGRCPGCGSRFLLLRSGPPLPGGIGGTTRRGGLRGRRGLRLTLPRRKRRGTGTCGRGPGQA